MLRGGLAGEEVVALGSPPWRIEKLSGTLTLRNSRLTKVTICDANGLPVGEAPAKRLGDYITVTLPSHAFYVVLRQD